MNNNKVVCVTGASGYIASWLIKLLLQRCYTVRGTVRNLHGDPKKVAHLKALEGAKDRLHLYEANLIENGSFDSVVRGCDAVFHTASPVLRSVTHPKEELIEPAVEGTLNVLKSCHRLGTCIGRVVITSSIASVTMNRNPLGPDTLVDETWFSDPELCEETKWYWLAKTLAEEAAVKFADQNGMDLVVMNPGFVVGPLLQPTLNASSSFILDLIDGKGVFPDYQFVDVRDVAYAHIMAIENPSANGRYILVESSLTEYETLQVLDKLYPSFNIPKNENGAGNPTFKVSKKKAETLGLSFMPLEMSLIDTIESLRQKKFLKI